MRDSYRLEYEGGRCPIGYEYVSGYYDNKTGKWVDSYCRKIKKVRGYVRNNT